MHSHRSRLTRRLLDLVHLAKSEVKQVGQTIGVCRLSAGWLHHRLRKAMVCPTRNVQPGAWTIGLYKARLGLGLCRRIAYPTLPTRTNWRASLNFSQPIMSLR